MDIKNNILETIGNTPLVRLNKITKDLPCTVLAKVEYFNPGNSAKDRMALKMVEVAEQEGKLKPGGYHTSCLLILDGAVFDRMQIEVLRKLHLSVTGVNIFGLLFHNATLSFAALNHF